MRGMKYKCGKGKDCMNDENDIQMSDRNVMR